MAASWEIREGGRDDLDALERHWRSMYAHHLEVNQGPLPFVPADERWPVKREAFERALDDGSAIFLLAVREDGELLGVAFSKIEPPNPVLESGVVGDLDTIVVAEGTRGTGIGEALGEADARRDARARRSSGEAGSRARKRRRRSLLRAPGASHVDAGDDGAALKRRP